MSQTFNLGGLGDNKLTKLIFSNGTANTCSIFLDNDGYLVFEQGANTVTFPLGDLPVDKRLAIENGRVVEGRDVVNTGTVDDGNQNQNNLVVDGITEDELTNAVEDALGVENLFSAKSEPQAGDGVYPGFANAMYFNGSSYLQSESAFGTPTNNKKLTFSFWIKGLDGNNNGQVFSNPNNGLNEIRFNPHHSHPPYAYTMEWFENSGSDSILFPEAKYRDPTAWYHFVCCFDFEASELENRMFVYNNGVKQSIHDTPYVANGTSLRLGGPQTHFIGTRNADYFLIGVYLANIQFIDGQALDASAFGQYLEVDGEETNIWIPKPLDPNTDYGQNGFYLDFSRNRLDSNGNIDMVHDVAPLTGTHTSANDWTAN